MPEAHAAEEEELQGIGAVLGLPGWGGRAEGRPWRGRRPSILLQPRPLRGEDVSGAQGTRLEQPGTAPRRAA